MHIAYLLIAASAIVSAGATALAWSHARRVADPAGVDVARLAAQLKRTALPERPAALLELAPAGSWERALAQELVDTKDPGLRVVLANDALAELGHTLDVGRAWPMSALRIALAASALLACIGYLTTYDLPGALPIVIPGAIAALLCLEAARRAGEVARKRRLAVDGLVDALMGPAARDQAQASASRRRRRRDEV